MSYRNIEEILPELLNCLIFPHQLLLSTYSLFHLSLFFTTYALLSADDVRQEFKRFGPISDVWIARQPPGFAFVDVRTEYLNMLYCFFFFFSNFLLCFFFPLFIPMSYLPFKSFFFFYSFCLVFFSVFFLIMISPSSLPSYLLSYPPSYLLSYLLSYLPSYLPSILPSFCP